MTLLIYKNQFLVCFNFEIELSIKSSFADTVYGVSDIVLFVLAKGLIFN